MHVLHVNWLLDPLRREPDALLDAWPTLADVACAANGDGVRVGVVQAAHHEAVVERGGVPFRFVAAGTERGAGRARSGAPRAGWPARRAPLRPTAILRRIRALRPDLIHVHGLSFPLQTRALVRALPDTPVLVQDHGDRPPPAWKRPLHRSAYAHAAGVAFTASAQAEPFRAAGILRPDQPVYEILESSSRFTPGDAAAARGATGLHGDPCLLWVGRLNANKDPLTVMEAVRRASRRLPGARLWLCFTEAPLLDAVRARLAADADLAARVRLLGAVPHATVQELLRAADFLVLGSRREGSGYAVIEALACGTTPLVTDIPAFRRITGDGAVGALSPPGDAAAMARAITDWAARDRDTLRANARAHFERELSFDAVGSALRAAYRAMARRHAAAAGGRTVR